MKVSYKIPAYLSNFSTLDNGRTIAKLKVFYIGETADGRIFSKEFADKLVGTLPYCPVVAFYSDIKEDFLGHNSTQYIYGLVQPTAEYCYEKDSEGKEWLVTEVMLYTDRHDNIGEVAEKIVGHPHSLEMNPKTAKYNVFRENGKTKIEFTEGSLVGLSVLGLNQKPAFTGSEFFMATTFSDMRAKFETFFSCLEENSRGEQMEKEQFETLANFARLSYTEKMSMAEKEICKQLGDEFGAFVVEMDDMFVTAQIVDYISWDTYFCRYNYVLNDVEFTVSNEQKVYAKYITKEEMDYLEGFGKSQEMENYTETTTEEVVEATEISEIAECAAEEVEESVIEECAEIEKEEEEEKEEDVNCIEEEDEEKDVECAEVEEEEEKEEEFAEPVSEEDEEEEKEEEEFKETEVEEEDDEQHSEEELPEEDSDDEEEKDSLCSTTTLSDSERSELEKYRRKEKIELINSFAELLDNAIVQDFVSRVDEYDYAKLEAELSIAHSRAARQTVAVATTNTVKPLSFNNIGKQSAEPTSYKDLVARILRK